MFLMFICVDAQKKKSSKLVRKKAAIAQSVSIPVETENWKQFVSEELGIACDFPKQPFKETIFRDEFGIQVKSSSVQIYINKNYYLIEVREYPKLFLPKASDLAEGYGEWLKTYILRNVKIRSERTFVFQKYSAVEFIYQQNPRELIIHRSIVVNQKLFQILFQLEFKKGEKVEQVLENNKERITKFFDSFKFTEEFSINPDVG